jgi:two-component system heavy metal sensor histidine kinase CusS
MLGRLDAAFTREKAFTGNVAHELRTPLAGVKAALEVCANQPRDPAEYRRVLGECLGAVDLMHRMVESLLSITRLGSGQITPRIERVRLTPLLHERWEEIAPRDKQIDVEWNTDDSIEAQADRALLRSVCSNLLDNAASYVNDGGSIRITARLESDRMELQIANTGSSIAPDDIAKVFEPFWRADPSRTATGRHCGLGLTLTRGYVERMGGSIDVRTSAKGEFVAIVRLPAMRVSPVQSTPEHVSR